MNKYIVLAKPGDVQLCEMDIPKPQKDEALLKLLYGGICGSDLNSYRGSFAYVSYPRIPGHEFSAEVIEIEKNDKGIKKGMIVTANPYFNCTKCYSCRRGLVNCCTTNQTMGVEREGAFAQYITMPIDRIYDGKGIDARTLALIEPFCISYHAVKRANAKAGEKVLIIGAGTIGTLAALAAKQFGSKVYMCDISKTKLDYAEQFDIDGAFLNEDPEQFMQNVKELTDGDGFDITIEAVGLPSTFQNCIDAVTFGGRVVLAGVSKENLDFNFTVIQKKELNIFGSRNALKEDFEQLVELVKNNKIDISKVITNQYSYEQAAQAFEEFDQRASEMLKVMLKF